MGQLLGEGTIKLTQNIERLGVPLLYRIKLPLHLGSKLHLDYPREVLLKYTSDHLSKFRGDELLFFFDHISTVHDGINDGRISARSPYALFFKQFDEAGFSERGGGFGKMLLGQ